MTLNVACLGFSARALELGRDMALCKKAICARFCGVLLGQMPENLQPGCVIRPCPEGKLGAVAPCLEPSVHVASKKGLADAE